MSILLFLLQTLVVLDESNVVKDKIICVTDEIMIDNVLRVSESKKNLITELSIKEVFINRKNELDSLCLKFKQKKTSLHSRHKKEK